MSDLILGEESRQFQELTRNFAQKEIAPKAHAWDHSKAFPEALFAEAAEMGLMNVLLPEEVGGLGLPLNDACVIVEEIAAACAATAVTFVANLIAIAPLLFFDRQSRAQRFFDLLSTVRFCGSNISMVNYSRKGDGFHVFADNATVLNGEHAQWCVVTAYDAATSHRTSFVLDTKDVEFLEQAPRLGLNCADIAQVKIAAVISKDRMVGEENSGSDLSQRVLSIAAPLLAACAAGVTRSALEHSLRYSKERHAFGQSISNFQSIAFMMADMARYHQASRLLTWRASRLFDTGVMDRTAALSAWGFAADSAMSAATDAVQIFGGYGYSKEYPVEKLMRDAKTLQMLAPTSFESRIELGRELMNAR